MASDGTSSPGLGITGGVTGDSEGMRMALAILLGISLYNAIELICLVFLTFHQYKGLYFWSLLVSALLGIIPYSLGFLFKLFQLAETWLSVTLLTVGWYAMVTGHSLVLYSRLHLVLMNQNILRLVLYMIIIDAIILHIPTTVLTYGSNDGGSPHAFISGYNVMEKIQMTGFCIQEIIISSLYVHEAIKLWKLDPGRRDRKIIYQLLSISVFIIIMDLGLLAIEYANYYAIEVTLKGVIYSIKLKLEIAVLGNLKHLVSHGGGSGMSEIPDFVNANQVTSDATTVSPAPRGRPNPLRIQSSDVSIALFEHSDRGWDQANGCHDASGSLSGETQTRATHPEQ